jgi:hypothetical protein
MVWLAMLPSVLVGAFDEHDDDTTSSRGGDAARPGARGLG